MKPIKRYTGSEKLKLDGKELPFSMMDFWSINLSAILLNMTRGSFAEFLVLCALSGDRDGALRDIPAKTGVEPYDIDGPVIKTPYGERASRIEVKSASSVQIDTPDEKEPISLPRSRLTFSIRKAIDWRSGSRIPQRNNDLYVFAHYKASRKTDDMLDLSFWDFYVYPTYKIIQNTDADISEQSTISVQRLKMIGVVPVSFSELKQEINRVTTDISAHYEENWHDVDLISEPGKRSKSEQAAIDVAAETMRELGYEYTARYIETYGMRAWYPGFTHGVNREVEKFYRKCVEEGHPYNWYYPYPKDMIF